MLSKPENREQLIDVLAFHVVPANVKADELAGKFETVRTVNGKKLMFDGRKDVKASL